MKCFDFETKCFVPAKWLRPLIPAFSPVEEKISEGRKKGIHGKSPSFPSKRPRL